MLREWVMMAKTRKDKMGWDGMRWDEMAAVIKGLEVTASAGRWVDASEGKDEIEKGAMRGR